MGQNFIGWNIENWITVLLMAALGYFAFALAAQGWHNFQGSQS